MLRKYILILIAFLALGSVLSAKMKVMNFDNPGNKRLLKSAQGNYYYFRSLPEKSMRLNTTGITSIELRAFAVESIRKPQVTITINKKSTTYNLSQRERSNGFYIYDNVKIAIPEGTSSIEVLCYDRGIYFRAFYDIPAKPKVTKTKVANMQVTDHSGIMTMTHNSSSSDYYTFTPAQPLRFVLNNGRNAVVYVRARLLDRSVPEFELYVNGEKVAEHEFSLKRTTTYSVIGINHLSIGKKLDLPTNYDRAVYELKAKSDHLFLARPVLLKQ